MLAHLGSSTGGAIETTISPQLCLLAGPIGVQLAAVAGLIQVLAGSFPSVLFCLLVARPCYSETMGAALVRTAGLCCTMHHGNLKQLLSTLCANEVPVRSAMPLVLAFTACSLGLSSCSVCWLILAVQYKQGSLPQAVSA